MMQNVLVKMDHKIILYFNHFLTILNLPERLQMQRLWRGSLKLYQMKVLKPLLYQIIAFAQQWIILITLSFE